MTIAYGVGLALLFVVASLARRPQVRNAFATVFSGASGETLALLALAAHVAGRKGQERVGVSHLIFAFTIGEGSRLRLAQRRLDAGRVAAQALAAMPEGAPRGPATGLDDEVRRIAYRPLRFRALRPEGLLDLLLAAPSARPFFEHAALSAASAPTRERWERLADVILHNDRKTPMVLVTTMLESIFELDGWRAMHLMLLVHHTGRGRLGPFDADRAAQLVDMAMRYARDRGASLLLTVEPHADTPLAWG